MRMPQAPAQHGRVPHTAETVAKIYDVVAHVALAVTRLDPHRECVLLARIEMLRPRREHFHTAQLTPILMSNDVIGVVPPRALIRERSERLTR